MIKYVAFDPGINTGVAGWDEDALIKFFKICKGMEALDKFLDELEVQQPPPTHFIYERYRVAYSRANYNQAKYAAIHGGKSVVAEQAIGSILRTARKLKVSVTPQEPSILSVALLHAGIPKPKGHLRDDLSAYVHGNEYLLRQKLITPRVLEQNKLWKK